LEPEERSVWTDLICLAGECGRGGRIEDNSGKPFPIAYLANTLNIPMKLLKATIDKCLQEERLLDEEGTLTIKNWSVYQSEYERQKQYR